MPKVPWAKRGLDRFAHLVSVTRVALGDKVWWEETVWAAGYPSTYWTFGIIEAKRGKVCLVRDRYGFERVVEVGRLCKPET